MIAFLLNLVALLGGWYISGSKTLWGYVALLSSLLWGLSLLGCCGGGVCYSSKIVL